jgi:hypothetical protein
MVGSAMEKLEGTRETWTEKETEREREREREREHAY